jgi:hypothetical protein
VTSSLLSEKNSGGKRKVCARVRVIQVTKLRRDSESKSPRGEISFCLKESG